MENDDEVLKQLNVAIDALLPLLALSGSKVDFSKSLSYLIAWKDDILQTDSLLVSGWYQNQRAIFALHDAGIIFIADALEMTDKELLTIPGIGKKAIAELRKLYSDAVKRSDEAATPAQIQP